MTFGFETAKYEDIDTEGPVFEVDPAFHPMPCDGCMYGTPYLPPSGWDSPSREGENRTYWCQRWPNAKTLLVRAGDLEGAWGEEERKKGRGECPHGKAERRGAWRLVARQA